MSKKCSACGRFANAAEGVNCTKCVNFYHKACVKIPSYGKIASTWLCPECKACTPRKDNTENPVRGEQVDYVTVQESPEHSVTADLVKEIRLMRRDMQTFRDDFSALQDGLSAVRSAVESFSGRINCMEARLDSLESKCAEVQARPDTGALMSTIEQLRAQISERDQESFSNDIEISGVPEEQGENLAQLISIVANKLGVSCDERDFVSVERTGVRRTPGSPSGGEPAGARPRPIVVRLVRRQLRDAFLQNARVRRGATTEGMGLAATPSKFYVNERLSKSNKMLFFKTRQEVHAHNWKYAWTRDGRIFVRRETGKAAFRVRLEMDLKKIFGGA